MTAADLIPSLLFACPCFLTARQMFLAWRDPMSTGHGAWVRYGVGIMVMEFVVVGSNAFFAAWASGMAEHSILHLVLFSLFYLGIAAIVAVSFESKSLFRSFAVLMIGRFVGIILPITRAEASYLETRAGVIVILYFSIVCLSLLPLPRGGISKELGGRIMANSGEGLWVEHPHRPVFLGAIYFLILGILELTLPFSPLRMHLIPAD